MSNTNKGSNTSNHSLWNYASYIWKHSQQLIKGVTLVTVGMIGYNFFTFFSNSKETKSASSTTSQATDLIEGKGLTKNLLFKATNQPIHVGASSFTSSDMQIDPAQTKNLIKFELNYPEQRNIEANDENNNILYKRVSMQDVTTIQTPIAIEFNLSNEVTIYNQDRPDVAIFNRSCFFVWQSEGQDGSIIGITGQKFDNRGNKIDSASVVNEVTFGSQIEPTIAKLASDLAIAGWTGDSYGINEAITEIYARVFNASNAEARNEFRINDNTNGKQFQPRFTSLPNGGALATWTSASGTYQKINFRLIDTYGNKVGVETQTSSGSYVDQSGSANTGFSDNGFAIIWHAIDYSSTNPILAVYMQFFNAAGTDVSSAIKVSTFPADSQFYPAATTLMNDDLAIVWGSRTGSNYALYGRLFNQSGGALTSDFRIDDSSTGASYYHDIATLRQSNSSFIVVWDDSNKIYAKLFDINGLKIGRQFQVSISNSQAYNSETYQGDYKPRVAELSDGKIIFAWTFAGGVDGSGNGIFSRILVPDITLFTYNTEIPKTYNEDNTFQFTNLVVNPMVDADIINATLTLSNPLAGSLSLESSNNTTATFDSIQGVWQVQNAGIVDLNRILEQLKFIPSSNFNSDFTIQVDLTDSNNNHTSYSNTLNMLGAPVNDFPVLTTNQLALNQGDTITLGLSNVDASDVDNASTDLSFQIDQLVQGQIENINNRGRAVTGFTYSQLANSEIVFIHDNTRFAPAYQVSVSDGNLTTLPQPAMINFNARPELINNQLSIDGGQTVIMTQDNLKASDDHTAEGELVFMISEVNHGQFKTVFNSDSTVTQFAQQQVIDGQVQFAHDGSTQAPSFKISVNDGYVSSNPIPVTVNFVANNNSLTANDTLPLALGVSIGGAALLAGVGIGIWQGKKQQQLRQEREQEPLANAVRSKLRVGNVDDFNSSQGRNYINFINTLKNELISQGIETEQMLPDEINELAGFISKAIKETMKENGIKHKKTVTGAIELNTQTLQTYVSIIAAKTQDYKNESQGLSHNATALKTINPVVNV